MAVGGHIPALHYDVDLIFFSFGIMDSIVYNPCFLLTWFRRMTLHILSFGVFLETEIYFNPAELSYLLLLIVSK